MTARAGILIIKSSVRSRNYLFVSPCVIETPAHENTIIQLIHVTIFPLNLLLCTLKSIGLLFLYTQNYISLVMSSFVNFFCFQLLVLCRGVWGENIFFNVQFVSFISLVQRYSLPFYCRVNIELMCVFVVVIPVLRLPLVYSIGFVKFGLFLAVCQVSCSIV